MESIGLDSSTMCPASAAPHVAGIGVARASFSELVLASVLAVTLQYVSF